MTNNLRISKDEVDILAVSPDGEFLAMIEVRSTADPEGNPIQTLGHSKRMCMARAARNVRQLAIKHRCELRIDLIEVNVGHTPPSIKHHEGILPSSN